ncbi:HEAT, type 2 [Phytophthora cactorum]|nr:HEAT, type 2 [Phytophthora cactorum]
MTSVDELKLQNTNFRRKERELVATLRQHVEAAEATQRSWKTRLAKRELKIESLRRQCQDRQEELERVESERIQENEERERDKLDEMLTNDPLYWDADILVLPPKSQSDLDKLNVDENMPEMERAEKLLKAGLDKQKISILNSLPKILANNNSKTNIGLILDCMKVRQAGMLACATVDGKVLSYPTVTFHEEYAQQLETCWAEKKDAVFLLSDEQITKLLVPFALDIITEIQQKDYAEEASSVVVALLPRIGSALKKTQSLPDYLIPSLGEQYGQLVTKLATLNHLGNDTGQVFLQGYSKLCSHEELEIRQYCAYNFPAIVKAFGSTYISTLMDDLLAKLASDPSEEVRHHIAAGIHEVAILLGQQRAMRYLKALVLSLMNDESPAVQGMAMSRVPQLLSAMINPNDEDQKVCILPRMIYFISANSPHASCTRLQSSIRLSNRSLSTMPFYRQAVIGISLCFLKRCKVFHPGSRPRKSIDLLDDPVPNVRWKAISLVPLWKNALCYLSDEKCLDRIRQFLDESTIDSDRDVANALHETRQVIESNTVGQQRRPQDDVDDKRKLSEEENLGLMTDHEDSSADSKWSSMLEYTLVVGKDGQVVRRARVKSFDLVNKIVRVPGKDTGRTGGMNISGGLGGMSSGSNSMTLAMGIGSKPDQSKLKATAPKTSNKPAPPITTLPNCATARPGHAKMPQAVKVANSTGKVIKSSGPTRSGTGLPKDTGVITKIPIIRPSAPAKRETSPSGSTKPSSATLVLAPAPSSRLGTIDNGGVGPSNRRKPLVYPNASKT